MQNSSSFSESKESLLTDSKETLDLELCLNDPIIQKMLTGSSIDYNDPTEIERLNRMTKMLKSSKKYRRLSVESANHKWANELDEWSVGDHENSEFLSQDSKCISRSSTISSERQSKVRFSDSVEVIYCQLQSNPTLLEKLAKAVKKMKNLV
jgi:hypothetical protein